MTTTFLCIMMLIISTSHQQQSIASNMNTPTNKNARPKSNHNPAKDARHLLDIMQQTKNIATALQEIIDVHAENLPKYVGKNLMDLSIALLKREMYHHCMIVVKMMACLFGVRKSLMNCQEEVTLCRKYSLWAFHTCGRFFMILHLAITKTMFPPVLDLRILVYESIERWAWGVRSSNEWNNKKMETSCLLNLLGVWELFQRKNFDKN